MTQGIAARLEERHDRYIELIKQFTIMNDIFMRNVLKEKACTEFILQIITENIGVEIMCEELQELYDEGVKEGEMLGIEIGEARGEMKKAKRSAILLSQKGTDLSDIAEVLEVGVDIVKAWIGEAVYE